MTVDIVKVTQYLTHAEDIKAYSLVRNPFLARHGRRRCYSSFLSLSGGTCSSKWR
jgi:hypothetical protein